MVSPPRKGQYVAVCEGARIVGVAVLTLESTCVHSAGGLGRTLPELRVLLDESPPIEKTTENVRCT